MTITLGLNAFHGDASACIFIDGTLIAAAEEERFTRVKHSAGFPINAINFCLDTAKVKISDIDFIAINRNPKTRIIKKLLYAFSNLLNTKNLINRIQNFKKINSLELEFSKNFKIDKNKIKSKIKLIDHHLAHVSSSVFGSSFSECDYLSVDGFGDFVSTSAGHFSDNNFSKYKEVLFPHSLGLFYTAITQYLGFKKYGDEYKVMGLSSYGSSTKYYEAIKKVLLEDDDVFFKLNLFFFSHHSKGVEMTWLEGEPKLSDVYNDNLIKLLGPARKVNEKIENKHMDIAASAQKLYEDILFKILNELHSKRKCDNLCLSGGCAMNSVANGKILENTPYKKIYINTAPGDSGGAIGSALIVIKDKYIIERSSVDNPYLGNQFDNKYIKKLLLIKSEELKKNQIIFSYHDDEEKLLKIIAHKISEGSVIGFFQGKMEFGPRALGNRSILADPRNRNMRDILNLKIKRRESFRPFAPSILKENITDWFEVNDDVPFMSKVYQVKKIKHDLIPAVVHIDGTGRLQTVEKKYNEKYYKLIKYFSNITDIPILLNTSFNENEPIVCKPEEALDCFLRTKMDYLILENYLLERT